MEWGCNETHDLVKFSIENLFVSQKITKKTERVFYMAIPGKADFTDLDHNYLGLMLLICEIYLGYVLLHNKLLL
jgi:hypothetical protein